MSYVVNWQRADGEPGWHQVADVQEAAAYIEHLRNHDGVEAKLYRLEDVAFEFKPYFKVELAVPSTSFAASIVPEPPEESEVPELETVGAPPWSAAFDEDASNDEQNGTGRRGLFGR